MAAELNTSKLLLETDCANLAKMLCAQEKTLSAVGPLVEEIKERMKMFQEVQVSWVRRSANAAADKLAKVRLSD